jgi:hypothetical protein
LMEQVLSPKFIMVRKKSAREFMKKTICTHDNVNKEKKKASAASEENC